MTQTQKDFLNKWITALRSGEYPQGIHNWFSPVDNTYCCLGVANKISGLGLNDTGQYCPSNGGGIFSTIPMGLSDQQLFELANMNDQGKSFHEIADYIEQTYLSENYLEIPEDPEASQHSDKMNHF